MGIIYKITFPNNKVYIGQTMYDLEKRKKQHKNTMNKNDNNQIVYKAMRKYGWENLKWDIIDYANTREELNEKEVYWINKYQSYIKFKKSNGYNATLGGDAVSILTSLTIEELNDFVKDCKGLMDKETLIKKYNISNKLYYKIVRGEIWSQYTKINKIDNEEKKTILNRFQVDYIIENFKENGDYKQIAEFLRVSPNCVRNVLIGATWREYTQVSDNFFTTYSQLHTKLSPKELLEIVERYQQGMSTKQLAEEYNVSMGYIQRTVSGRSNSIITNLSYKTREELQKGTPINATITKEEVLKIVYLYKQENMSVKDISIKMNIKERKIRDIINGVTFKEITNIKYIPKKRQYTQEDVKNIRERYKNGESQSSIAKSTGFSLSTIFRIVHNKTHIK